MAPCPHAPGLATTTSHTASPSPRSVPSLCRMTPLLPRVVVHSSDAGTTAHPAVTLSYRIVTLSCGPPPRPATQMRASEVAQATTKLITASALA